VKSRLVLIVAAALFSASVLAQSESQPSTDSAFDALDANKDGHIDKSEAQASLPVTQGFATADTNHDGVITREELNAAFRMRPPDAAPPSAPAPQPQH
jgi:Ca2+-binding EF-hand superfamily protein